MSYIGNPIVSTDFPVDYFSGNGSTTAFTLSIAPASVNAVDVLVSGVAQSPQTYTISGTTLTFSAAPPSGSSNIVVKHRGIAGIPNTPSAASVVPASMSTGAPYWDTSGNVGIGTSSPANNGAGTTALTINGTTDSRTEYWVAGAAVSKIYTGTDFNLWCTGSANMRFSTAGTERMRITSTGKLNINGTANNGAWLNIYCTDNSDNALNTQVFTNGNNAVGFKNAGGTQVGSITTNASTVAYNTSSDYRLKEDIAPLVGALDRIAQLKPVTYKWKTDGSEGEGFIAHELQEVVPECVTGEKDAVDAEGNPKYQGIDTSFLVATLTAAIQELKAELDATKAEVAALKGAA